MRAEDTENAEFVNGTYQKGEPNFPIKRKPNPVSGFSASSAAVPIAEFRLTPPTRMNVQR